MRVKFLGNVNHSGQEFVAGDESDIDSKSAEILKEIGMVEFIDSPVQEVEEVVEEPKVEKPKRRRSRKAKSE